MTPGMSATVFDVWAHAAGNMHRIVLVEELDRLDCDELFAVRPVYGYSSAIQRHLRVSKN
jgi:hypothetical protein